MRNFKPSFVLAVALHILIVLLFSISFLTDSDTARTAPPAEVIEATILDGAEIDAEAERLKQNEANKHQAEVEHQQQLENARKAEEQALQQAKKQRVLEEQKIQEAAERRKQEALEEQKRQEQLAAKRKEEEKS